MSEIMTGDDLREIRKGLGLSQQQLADLCGVIRPTASDWERGKSLVPLLVARVMRVLAVEPLLIYKFWPAAKPLVAPRKRQEEEMATPDAEPAPVPLIERLGEDDGTGARATLPEGEVPPQGDDKGEPKPAEAVTVTDAQSADAARRMAQIMKSLNKHGKGRK